MAKQKKFRYLYVVYDPNLGEYFLLRANTVRHALKRYREEWRYADVDDDYWKRVVGNIEIKTWNQHLKEVLKDRLKGMHKNFRKYPDDIKTLSSELGPLHDFDT